MVVKMIKAIVTLTMVIVAMVLQVTYDIVTGEDGDETTNKCMLSKLLQLSVLEPVEVAVQLLNLKVVCVCVVCVYMCVHKCVREKTTISMRTDQRDE